MSPTRSAAGIRCLAIAAVIFLLLVCAAPSHAGQERHHRHPYPSWWLAQAHCIHWHEAVSPSTPTAADLAAGWRIHWHLTTYYGTSTQSTNRGGLQISVATWASFAPAKWTRDPAAASRAQQLLVAWRIWRANGRRWGGNQWPGTAAACGLQ